jgi:fatty acid desaturase
MSATIERAIPVGPDLREELRRLRRVDNWTNLGFLALDYACLIAVIGGAILFAEHRADWGLGWRWNIPVFGLAVVLVGALQHRLSGLAHEASHFSFLKNRFANDFVADVFCMFPIFSTVHFYRLFHLAHHQYTNDPAHDPDLVNLGPAKRVDDFPMSRLRTIVTVYFRALVLPLSFLRYQWVYIYINTMGKGGNVFMKRLPEGDAESRALRLGTVLGLAYLVAYNASLWRLFVLDRGDLVVPAAAIGLVASSLGVWLLPGRFFFQSPLRQAYSPRVASFFRLTFYTAAFATLGYYRCATGGRTAIYPIVLWYLPLTTTYMFYMLLRDVYQHTNADDGRLTNSRVFFVDAFTRWAVFVHGQDMHVPHHLYPTIPHYRLPRLHALLKTADGDYASNVVECRGTFANDGTAPTILDVLTETRGSRSNDIASPL